MKAKITCTYTVEAVIEADDMDTIKEYVAQNTPSEVYEDAVCRNGSWAYDTYDGSIIALDDDDETPVNISL